MIASIAIIGLTGSGKSTLSNTLISKENIFKESNEVESETREAIGKEGIFNNRNVYIIDTPGLFDSHGQDNINLLNITNFIRNRKDLKSFIITLNFNNDRIDEANLRLFQILSNMYPEKKWYNHICIVWTKYYSYLTENLKNPEIKKNGFKRFLKLNFPEINDEEINSIPQFFIDSIEARNINSPFREYLNQIIDWSNELNPIIDSLGNIINVDKVIKKKIEEIEKDYIKSSNGSLEAGYLNQIIIDRKRYQLIHYDNTISYSDYEEIENTKRTKEIRIIDKTLNGPHKVETQCINHVSRVLGVCVRNEYERHGYYYEERVKVNEERIGYHDINDVPKFGNWVEIKRGKPFNYTVSYY